MAYKYITQLGLIILPICLYQIWGFRKSFNDLPLKTIAMGMYGGIAAILCQLLPVSFFGITENFQCVPVILSILYGKRKAGVLSIGILVTYEIISGQSNLILFALAVLVYSAIPMLICERFERFTRIQRLALAGALSVVTLVVELMFLVVVYVATFGSNGLAKLAQYYNMLGVACAVQLVLMGFALFLLENIVASGRLRYRFESIIRNNPLGICAVDLNNSFLSVNSAYERITGYKESELLGKSRLDMWFAEDRDYAEKALKSVFQGEMREGFEVSLRHKSGRKVTVQATIVPITEGKDVIGYFSLVADITESRITEEALRSSAKLSAIGQLAAGVAHEIRNPLTSLKGFVQLLESTDAPKRYTSIMQDELTRIELITSELLVLAKPQAVLFSFRDIGQKLKDVLYLLTAQATIKSIEVVAQVADNVPPVECEPNQLKQVFINVVKNAIEATEVGGKVTVQLQQLDDNQIVIHICDTGRGIPKAMLSRLGEPFFTTKQSGTGLGLMVCKRIIENHHGQLEIASEVGRGTTVSITLPCEQPQKDTVGNQEQQVISM